MKKIKNRNYHKKRYKYKKAISSKIWDYILKKVHCNKLIV